MKLISTVIVLLGTAVGAFALEPAVPEIDGNTAAAAIAIVSGGLLVLRGRRKK